MVRLGRTATGAAVAGTLLLLLLTNEEIRASVNGTPALATGLYIVAAITVSSAFVSWGTAMYHAATRLPTGSRTRARWLAGTIFGVFIGSWAYWITAKQRSYTVGPA